MGLVIRSTAFNTALTYGGLVLGYVNMVLLFPLWFAPEAVGLVRLLLSLSVVYAQVAGFGLANTINRFFPQFRTGDGRHNGALFWSTVMALAGFAIITIVYVLLRGVISAAYVEKSPLFLSYYGWLIALGGFTLAFQVLETLARSVYRTIFSTFLREVGARVLTTVPMIGYHIGYLSFHAFVVVFVLGTAVIVLLLLADLVVSRSFRLRAYAPLPWGQARGLLQYGLWSFFSGASLLLLQNIDTVMLAGLVGLAQVGIYGTFFLLAVAVTVPTRAVARILTPMIADAWQQNNLEAIALHYRRASSALVVVGLLLWIGIWVNEPNILAALQHRPGYEAGFLVAVIVGAAYVVDMSVSINAMIIATSPLYRWDTFFNIGLVGLAVCLNTVLIPRIGILGAAWAAFASLTLFNIVKWAFVWVRFGMQPLGWGAGKALGAAALAFAVGRYAVPPLGHWLVDAALRSLAVAVVYGALIVATRAMPEANRRIATLTGKWRR